MCNTIPEWPGRPTALPHEYIECACGTERRACADGYDDACEGGANVVVVNILFHIKKHTLMTGHCIALAIIATKSLAGKN